MGTSESSLVSSGLDIQFPAYKPWVKPGQQRRKIVLDKTPNDAEPFKKRPYPNFLKRRLMTKARVLRRPGSIIFLYFVPIHPNHTQRLSNAKYSPPTITTAGTAPVHSSYRGDCV